MRALRSVPLVLAALVPLGLAACGGARSSPRVVMEIVDPSAIEVGYDLRRDEAARLEVRSQGVTDAGWEDVLRGLDLAEWPRDLADPSALVTRREAIRRYRAYRVATFRGNVLLFVPAGQGDRVPEDMQGRDFYLVVRQSGVRPVN